jgi:MFS family permease
LRRQAAQESGHRGQEIGAAKDIPIKVLPCRVQQMERRAPDVMVLRLKLPASELLVACTLAAVGWLVFTLLGGRLGDRIGRVRTFQLGYVGLALWAVPMWFLIDSGSIAWFFVAALVLSLPLGITYGPQAALYAEMFPARVRYSGVSVGYALGSILGGAFAATIAQGIVTATGKSWLIGVYLVVLSAISFAAASLVRDPMGVDLDVR